MASSRKSGRNRRAIVAIRSQQARLNAQNRVVTSLKSYDETAIGRLSDANLIRVAVSLGRELDARKEQVRNEAQREYFNVPVVRLTKRDMMYASRPLISDQQIASAPSGKRHVLRQQQRRRAEAREKLRRQHQYAALRVHRSIEQQRLRESRGENIAETGVPTTVMQGDERFNRLLTNTNVLKDAQFVASMPREALVHEMADVADVLGKSLKRADRQRTRRYGNVATGKDIGPIGSKRRREYEDSVIYRKLSGALGTTMGRKYLRMNEKQRRQLRITTGFLGYLDNIVTSPKGDKSKGLPHFQFVNDRKKDVDEAKRTINDFMEMALHFASK